LTETPSCSDYFTFFNEVGIIDQIGRAFLEARLPEGLIAPHFAVVNHLIRVSDGQTPLVLARAFQVPKTTMTHTLAGLERHGLVEMRPNPDDGRSKRIWLTVAGRRFHDAAIADMGPLFAELAQEVPPEAIATALPVLSQVRRVIDRMRDRHD
jgi:DNA-binding MarR family transcriptional regulator